MAKNFMNELRAILNAGLENIASSLGLALNRELDVKLGEIRPVDAEELPREFPEDLLYAQSRFSEGLTDKIGFLLTPAQAASWADLMMMGAGKAEFSPGEHLDAIAELLNQITSAWSISLSGIAQTNIQLEPFKSELTTCAAHAEDWSSCFRVNLEVEIVSFPKTILVLLLTPQTIEELQILMPKNDLKDVDRPPPTVLDEDLMHDDEPEVRSARFEDFGPEESGGSRLPQNLESLMDLELPVIIELGRTNMFIKDILELSPGSIIELNKLSGEPVDLFVNDKKFARGEVVVIDQNFGIRITDLVKVEDRIRSLR